MNYNDTVIKPFKKELRRYHDKINGDNPYNLKKIAGRKNIFKKCIEEAQSDVEDEPKEYGILDDYETDDDNVRLIKGTHYRRVVNSDGSYSIIDENGKKIRFRIPKSGTKTSKFTFVDVNIDIDGRIEVITDTGDILYFDIDNYNSDIEPALVNEDCGGIGVGDIGFGAISDTPNPPSPGAPEGSISYKDVADGLMIPFISRYKILDTHPNKKKTKKFKKKRK